MLFNASVVAYPERSGPAEVEPFAIKYCDEVPPVFTKLFAFTLPTTSNFSEGVAVPIPTLPALLVCPLVPKTLAPLMNIPLASVVLLSE